MVERQFDRLVDPFPGGLGRVVAPPDRVLAERDDGRVRQRDRAPSGVAARLVVEADGGEGAVDDQAGLLAQLAPGAGVGGLVHLEEAAGQGPGSGERIVLAADQEDAERPFDPREGDEVDRVKGSDDPARDELKGDKTLGAMPTTPD